MRRGIISTAIAITYFHCNRDHKPGSDRGGPGARAGCILAVCRAPGHVYRVHTPTCAYQGVRLRRIDILRHLRHAHPPPGRVRACDRGCSGNNTSIQRYLWRLPTVIHQYHYPLLFINFYGVNVVDSRFTSVIADGIKAWSSGQKSGKKRDVGLPSWFVVGMGNGGRIKAHLGKVTLEVRPNVYVICIRPWFDRDLVTTV